MLQAPPAWPAWQSPCLGLGAEQGHGKVPQIGNVAKNHAARTRSSRNGAADGF